MPATFVVEDGTGLETANSYISVADADQYNDDHDQNVLWVDSSSTGSLHIAIQPSDADSVTIDGKTYIFQAILIDVDGNVKIGSTLAFSQANLKAAINDDIDEAEDAASFADSMTIHPTVSAGVISSDVIPITAKTPGIAGNSIATTSVFADELNHFETATLSGATDVKEKHLRLATQHIDANYVNRWKGLQKIKEQALDWPRQEVEDQDDFFRDSDSIPIEVEQATVEAALRSIAGTVLMADLTNPGTVLRQKNKVGPLEQDTTYQGGNSPIPRRRIIDRILAPILLNQDSLFRS